MKAKFKGWLYFIAIVLFVYFLVNIEIYLWHIIDPEGLWGFFWFYSLSIVCFSSLISLIGVFGFVFQKNSEKGRFKLILGLLAFLIVSSIMEFGPSLFVNRKLSDRYRYLERSDRYFAKGQYEEALKYAEKVYSKAKNTELPSRFFIIPYLYEKSRLNYIEHYINLYNATFNYAYCLQATGKDITSAEKLYKTCIKICQVYFPDKKEFIVSPITSCFSLYMARGDRQKSDSTYLQLSKYLNKLDDQDVDNTVMTLMIYSLYAKQNGDFENMFNLQTQALSVYEKYKAKSKSTIHLILRTIVISAYLQNNDLISASKLIEETELIAKKNKDDETYMGFLNVKSRLFSLTGRVVEEEDILIKIQDEIKDRQGEQSLEYSNALYNQAVFYYRRGLLKDADSYFTKAIKIATPYSTDHAINYYDLLLASALCDYSSGNIKSTKIKLSLVNVFLLKYISSSLILLSENEKESLVLSYSGRLDLINTIYASLNEPSINTLLYDNILATKGIALQSNQFFRQLVFSSGQQSIISQYNHINHIKDSLNTLSQSGVQNSLALSQVSANLIQSEKKFVLEFINTSKYKSNNVTSVHWKDIRNHLKNDEVAVEYIRTFSLSNFNDYSEYYALLIKPNSQFPLLIPLGNEKALNEILKVKGNTSEKIKTIYSGESFKKIYDQVWAPLLPHLANAKTIYISLSGIFYQLSFPALTAKEPYNVVCLSSTRKIMPSQIIEEIQPSKKATLYGDINYNQSQLKPAALSEKNPILRPKLSNFITRSGFQPLPFTKIEIDEISDLLAFDKYEVRKILGSNATEKSFKELYVSCPKILHISTHGFYIPQNQPRNEAGISSLLNYQVSELQNPLYRSGLLFAGANNYSNNTAINDGILTGYEISQLNLSSTDLVVLSACETGLGEIRGDEGVFGLQRAFKLAGVNSIIMSLWKIPDQQTAELMQYFYKFYISGKSKSESLKLAQKRISLKYPDPYFWAAFVLID